ncbi:hypothetical protein ACLBOM_38350 [Escherichia coli]
MPIVDDVDLGYAYTLKPEEAIKYFRKQGIRHRLPLARCEGHRTRPGVHGGGRAETRC